MVKEMELKCVFNPGKLSFPELPMFQYTRSIEEELASGDVSKEGLLDLLEQMVMARCLEEMISDIKQNAYEPLPKFDYFGPTHLSIGQEATSIGAISALRPEDYITSSHRGHSDAMAKGCSVIRQLDEKGLAAYLAERAQWLAGAGEAIAGGESRDELEEKALRVHVYRMITELFG